MLNKHDVAHIRQVGRAISAAADLLIEHYGTANDDEKQLLARLVKDLYDFNRNVTLSPVLALAEKRV